MPKPGKQQLLVKVQASSVNPFEIKVQAGEMRPIMPSHLPFIPGKCTSYKLDELQHTVSEPQGIRKQVTW